ncbi:hypothetical protein ACIHJG_40580 [Streptomyces sp. NPDC052415]|uniref:hypothetical protein n=1 Tax=Streptomyces sp. NPDC052415 TaxID=3365690 RepID=UPI0037CCD0CB
MLTYARPGDTVHISEMFRLVRGTGHILDVLDVLHRDRLALRIHDGAFSAMDLTARHPRTGELLPAGRNLSTADQALARRKRTVPKNAPPHGRQVHLTFSHQILFQGSLPATMHTRRVGVLPVTAPG